jgi:Na+/proline symporter/signal transduction histidine kinase
MELIASSYFNIDIAIVITFLSITLGVGFYYGRGVTTIEDYALGGRNFSTPALVSTIVATAVSGGLFMIGISRTYSHGFYDLLPTCGMALSLIFIGYIFVPRMTTFLGSFSIAQSIGEYYGKQARIIAAICSIIANVGAIGIQYKVFGGMVAYFLNLDSTITIIVSGTIVTLYSAFGGIRSVTFTDVFQFMVFGFIVPLIGIVIWQSTFYIENFTFQPALESNHFNIAHVLDYKTPEFWQMVTLFFYFSLPTIFPAVFQRIIIGRNVKQIKTAFKLSALILLTFIITVAWIGFLLYSINPNLSSGQLVPYIVDNYTMMGFKGLIVIGIMAMAMSSADSFINVASVLFAHDICKPLNIFAKDELLITRLFALFLGIGSIFLALSEKDLFEITLFVNSFFMPIVSMPLLITILGFRTTKKSALSGMGAGFFTVVIWKIAGIDFDPIVPAMLVNLVFMLGTHYLLKQDGGWVQTKIVEEKVKIESLYDKWQNFNFAEFIRRNSAKDEATYSFFGIFCFINTISTIYLTQSHLLGENANIMLFIYQVMLVISTIFMFYLMWSPRIKHPVAVGIVWNIALAYVLVFCSSLFLFMSEYNKVQLVVFTMNLMVLFTLCPWKTALVMIITGFVSSIAVYKNVLGGDSFDIGFENNYNNLIYIALLSSTALIAFLKPKQEYVEAKEHKVDNLEVEVGGLNEKITDLNEVVTHYSERVTDQQAEIERLGATAQKILNNVNHELRLPVGNVMNFAEMLNTGLEKFSAEQLKMLSDEVLQNSNRLSTMILNMLDLATLDVEKVELKRKTVNISELVEDRVQNCRKIYLQGKQLDFEMTIEPDIFISIDPNYIRQAVDNLVINAITYSDSGVIKVSMLRRKNMAVFQIQDEGMGIGKEELYDIFTPFKMGIKTESKAQGRGVGLALCKSAIEAHGGIIKVESNGRKGATFRFELDL